MKQISCGVQDGEVGLRRLGDTDFSLTTHFDRWAESYDEDVKADDWIHRGYEEVLRLVAEKAKGVVVDIGCGTGNILEFAKCEEYIGVEPSAGMRAKFLGKHGFEPLNGHQLQIK